MRHSIRGGALLLTAMTLLSANLAAAERRSVLPKLAVLPLAAIGVDTRISGVLSDILTAELAERGRFQVMGMDEVNALLGLDKLKNALGCDDLSCAAELGGALGAELMVSGNVSRLGSTLSIKLALFDTQSVRVLNRVRETVPGDEDQLEAAFTPLIDRLLARLPSVVATAAPSTERPAPSPTLAEAPPRPADVPPPRPSAQPPHLVASEPGLDAWRTAALGAWAVAAVGAVAGGVLAKLAADQSARIETFANAASASAPYPDPYPYSRYLEDRQRYDRLRLGYVLAFGASGLALAGGLFAWFALSQGPDADQVPLALVPSVTATGLGLSVAFVR